MKTVLGHHVCCSGISGLVCVGDLINHAVLRSQVRWICDWHERIITAGV
jgi:hypothetical protein